MEAMQRRDNRKCFLLYVSLKEYGICKVFLCQSLIDVITHKNILIHIILLVTHNVKMKSDIVF